MELRRAQEPFQFMAASYLIRIRRELAHTLGQLARCLRSCSETSIFYHTFQSLETHHYVAFSSDFAQWTLTACNEAALAERLAMVDLREVVSLDDLRRTLVEAVDAHLRAKPSAADRPALEPFYFCEAVEVTFPTQTLACTLAELAAGIRQLSLQSLHFHFINSRLRLQLRTNDFSHWIERSLGMPALAAKLNRIDFYNDTLEELRQDLLALLANGENV